jgi:hypothetical protein
VVLDQWGSIWTASTGLPGVCVAYSGIKIVCVPPDRSSQWAALRRARSRRPTRSRRR